MISAIGSKNSAKVAIIFHFHNVFIKNDVLQCFNSRDTSMCRNLTTFAIIIKNNDLAMKLTIAIAALLCLLPTLAKSQTGSDPSDYATISSDRPDGRFISSYAISRQLVKEMRPSCEYRENMNASEFSAWQDSVREGMRRIMKFPTNVEHNPHQL